MVGVHRENGKVVALKVIPIEDDIGIEELMKEIDILKLCTDEFVVDYYEHYEIHRHVWIGKLIVASLDIVYCVEYSVVRFHEKWLIRLVLFSDGAM